MKEVTEIIVNFSNAFVRCPVCGAEVSGWIDDPRGKQTTCDECGAPFKISEHADLEAY